MSFNESNTIKQMILDAVENLGRTTAVAPMHKTHSCWESKFELLTKFSLGSEK
jgi:hypothetical protein